jgi:hypothetical protein
MLDNELDELWNNYKKATWQELSVAPATIWETKEND